jgi:MFS transporter, DHA1 family, multidrug resistance protein
MLRSFFNKPFHKNSKFPKSKIYESCIYIIVIAYMGCLKLSLPALVYLASYFAVSDEKMKLTVACFLFVYGIAIFIWGFLSEIFGRLRCLYAGFIILIIGSVIVFTSFDYWSYFLGRCLEAFGAGVGSPIMRALIFDVYNKKDSKIVLSRASMTSNPVPGIAPLLGGYIFYLLGWRYIFIIYCILVICVSIFLFFNLPETSYNYLNKKTVNIKNIFKEYLNVIKNKTFWAYAVCYFCFTGVMLGYYAALPFWFIKGYGISSHIYT